MNHHLHMAQRALENASIIDVDLSSAAVPIAWQRQMNIASIHAQVAQADALERIARALERQEATLRPRGAFGEG